MAVGAGVNNMGVSSSSPAQRTSVSVSACPAAASASVTCSPYYWTLFFWQSRKEERRGTLIAHLNGGCHIINAYRPALQPVTETPSHTGREEEEGEWDINSCERRDGYQRPEIKRFARDEARNKAAVEVGVQCTCFARYLSLSSRSLLPDLLVSLCSFLLVSVMHYDEFPLFYTSDIYLELSQTEVLFRSFLCFYACIQLLSSADCNPSEPSLCVYVCVSPFFSHFGKCWTACLCVSVCVCERCSAECPLIQREF